MTARPPAQGVAALADRPADPRRAALVVGVCALIATAAARPIADAIYDTANEPPAVLEAIRRLRDRSAPVVGVRRAAVVVLVDGLRADEADRMPVLRRLRATVRARLRVDLPTLSRVAYHTLFTGAPPSATGVRSNRFSGHARLDSLADRAREAGGHVTWIAAGNDWLARMFARPSDTDAHRPDALGAPLDAALAAMNAHGGRPSLTVVHVLEVDRAGHASGVRGEARRRAVVRADRVIERVARAAERSGAIVVVLADHGHIDVGGHGGDEPEVQSISFVARVPPSPGRRLGRPLRAAEVAPTLAAWMGMAPPRTATAFAVPELVGQLPATDAGRRSMLVASSDRALELRLEQRRIGLCAIVVLAALMALGAIKRAFGFDRATAIGPVVTAATVIAVHVGAWQRPLTASAIDDIDRYGPLVAGLGAFAALAGILMALAARGGAGTWRATARRASAACALGAVASAGFAIAWCGGALGPWALSAYASHAPILLCIVGAGVCASSGVVLLASRLGERTLAH